MTAKSNGIYAADGSEYITLTDGAGNLVTIGTGTGTVTSASVVTANGVSGSVATATSTPAITLTLGAITPTTVACSALLTVDTDGRTVSAAETNSVFTNEGATALDVFTLPTAVAGLMYSGVVQDADGFKFVANTGDTIRIAGTASASAGYIQSTTIGSTVHLVAINATEWIATAVQGTWTVDS